MSFAVYLYLKPEGEVLYWGPRQACRNYVRHQYGILKGQELMKKGELKIEPLRVLHMTTP